METAGSEAIAGGLESQMSNGGDVIILSLNRSTFLPIANIVNVLCKNVYVTEKRGEESENPEELSTQSRKVGGPCVRPDGAPAALRVVSGGGCPGAPSEACGSHPASRPARSLPVALARLVEKMSVLDTVPSWPDGRPPRPQPCEPWTGCVQGGGAGSPGVLTRLLPEPLLSEPVRRLFSRAADRLSSRRL